MAINTSGSLLYPAAVGTTYAGRVESAQRRDNDERARQERSLPQQSVDLVAFQREAESRFIEKVQTLTPADSLQNLPYESRKAISLYENNQYARSPDEDGLERGVDIFI